MKMAKATERDLEMAMTLTQAFESFGTRWGAVFPGTEEIFDINDDRDCARAMRQLMDIVAKGSLPRVVYGMAVLLDPANKMVDPDDDTLEHHPERLKAMASLAEESHAPEADPSRSDDQIGAAFLESVGFRYRHKSGGEWNYVYHRAPDSFELRECEIEDVLAAVPQPPAVDSDAEKPIPEEPTDKMLADACMWNAHDFGLCHAEDRRIRMLKMRAYWRAIWKAINTPGCGGLYTPPPPPATKLTQMSESDYGPLAETRNPLVKPPPVDVDDNELPGMWSKSDFEGGAEEVRGPD